MSEKYDLIGTDYNLSRSADIYLTHRIIAHLDPAPDGKYLEIGCGTGNYTNQFQKAGLSFTGIDPSNEMLKQAKLTNENIGWSIGTADKTGLEDASFDGAVAFLTIHHWPDLINGFTEQCRVLKNNGKLVIFTSTPEQMRGYWLCHYFPDMLEAGINQMPCLSTVSQALEKSGFEVTSTEKYFVKPQLEDLFLYSGKHNPSLYMQEQIRNGISTFSDLAESTEVSKGLEALATDIESGKVNEIIDSYANEEGDYLFISCMA